MCIEALPPMVAVNGASPEFKINVEGKTKPYRTALGTARKNLLLPKGEGIRSLCTL
jgi:hypothetical protein